MLKINLKLTGNQKLSRNELKKVTGGGIIPPGCSISCTHRLPNGPIQFGCPSYEECVPYRCDDIWTGERCQPL